MIGAVITFLLISAGLPLHFSHLSIEEGLSNNSIIDLCEDTDGNLWVATRNGLNRYDGYDFVAYNQQSDIPGSIFTDAPLRLCIDGDGVLWVASYNGLSKFERSTGCFSNYRFQGGSMVSDMLPLDDRRILVSFDRKLMVFDKENCYFVQTEDPLPFESLATNCMVRSGSKLILGCEDGLWSMDPDTYGLRRLWDVKGVVKICNADEHSVWIGTQSNGVYRYSFESGADIHLSKQSGFLNSNYIKDLATDSGGALWIGTFSGLNIYDPSSGTVKSVTYSPDSKDGLTQAYVSCLMCDSQEGMWAGTYYGGLNYYHPLRDRFVQNENLESLNRISDHIFNSIVEDDRNDLWIGTDIGDIIHYDSRLQKWSSFYFHGGEPDKIPFTEIKSIITTENRVYVCAYAGGMLVYDKQSGHRTYYNQNLGNLPSSKIYSLSQADDGGLWIATLDGIYKFSPESGNLTGVHTDTEGRQIPSFCRVLFKDSKGHLWLGTKNGCKVYSDDGDALTECQNIMLPPQVSSLPPNCFYESKDGTIFIGTSEGVFKLQTLEEGSSFTRISVENGLSNNVVKAMLEDGYGRLWISTYNGLNTLDLNNGTVRRYSVSDGLPSNQFLARSCCHLHDGGLLFGSVKGIVRIDPERVRDNPHTPKPVFDYVSSGGEQIIVSSDKIILDKGQKDFSVKFAVRDFVSGKKNSYAFKLEGYDKDWIVQEGNASLNYSEVSPGSHLLMMKACNSDGIWNEEPTTLKIIISRAWYETLWFMAALLLIVLLSSMLAWRRHLLRRTNAPLVIVSGNGEDRYTITNVRENYISGENKAFLEDVIRIIEDGITNYDFSTDLIAQKMNISRTNLHNKLKGITGNSAIKLISEVRFSRAKRLLKDGHSSIAEVSTLCGFRTQAYFAARFKKEFGCTPSEYVSANK